jgi:hypothetical protein
VFEREALHPKAGQHLLTLDNVAHRRVDGRVAGRQVRADVMGAVHDQAHDNQREAIPGEGKQHEPRIQQRQEEKAADDLHTVAHNRCKPLCQSRGRRGDIRAEPRQDIVGATVSVEIRRQVLQMPDHSQAHIGGEAILDRG